MSSRECPGRVSRKSVLSRVSNKSVKQECQERVSSKSVLSRLPCQECPVKSVKQKCQARVSRKSDKQECPVKIALSRVSCQECQAKVSSKSVKQECQERVTSKSVLSRVSSKECQERVSSKSVKKECLARVSSKRRVLSRAPCKTLLLLDDCASHLHKEKTRIFISALVSVYSALHKVTAVGFVGSISFFFGGGVGGACVTTCYINAVCLIFLNIAESRLITSESVDLAAWCRACCAKAKGGFLSTLVVVEVVGFSWAALTYLQWALVLGITHQDRSSNTSTGLVPRICCYILLNSFASLSLVFEPQSKMVLKNTSRTPSKA